MTEALDLGKLTEIAEAAALLESGRNLLTNIAQILDVVQLEWAAVDGWSEWDAEQRRGITAWLTRFYALKAVKPDQTLAALSNSPLEGVAQADHPDLAPVNGRLA